MSEFYYLSCRGESELHDFVQGCNGAVCYCDDSDGCNGVGSLLDRRFVDKLKSHMYNLVMSVLGTQTELSC